MTYNFNFSYNLYLVLLYRYGSLTNSLKSVSSHSVHPLIFPSILDHFSWFSVFQEYLELCFESPSPVRILWRMVFFFFFGGQPSWLGPNHKFVLPSVNSVSSISLVLRLGCATLGLLHPHSS